MGRKFGSYSIIWLGIGSIVIVGDVAVSLARIEKEKVVVDGGGESGLGAYLCNICSLAPYLSPPQSRILSTCSDKRESPSISCAPEKGVSSFS